MTDVAAAEAAPRRRTSMEIALGYVPPEERPIVGRQALVSKWTPSKPMPWVGSITGTIERTAVAIIGGDRFTTQQVAALKRRGIDVQTVESTTVRRHLTMDEVWVPNGQYRPVLGMECPVLHRRVDGRIMVITPSGDAKLIRADGWAEKPPRWPVSQMRGF